MQSALLKLPAIRAAAFGLGLGLTLLGACAPKVREAPHCSVASCCPSGGYVYEPIRGCVPADRLPYCGCVCKGDPPYESKSACEAAVQGQR
jgi:hypothetical protein